MKEKYSKLGIFTIELWRSKIMHAIEPTSDFKADALEPVPEKALKGQALDIATTYAAYVFHESSTLILSGSKLPLERDPVI